MKQGNSASSILSPLTLAGLSGLQPNDHLDIGLVGDVLLSEAFLDQADRQGCRDLRDALWRPLADCSLILANLEAPITAHEVVAENKAYNLKTARRALDVFDSRFVLSLANNHIMDYGAEGLFDTIDALDAAGIAYAGAGRDIDHARAPRYVSIAGIESAVICAADSRFQAAKSASPGTCPAFPDLLVESIGTARRRARFVGVSIHMGLEYVDTPSAAQIHLAERCLSTGAQLVQFHHSHCLSGAAGDGRGVVLFGTGNFVFPDVTKFVVAKAKQSALWRARFSERQDAIVALDVEPAVIDSIGMPHLVSGRDAERGRMKILQCSQRTLSPAGRELWRLHDMLCPGFLLNNFDNYLSMLRRRGPRFVFRNLVAGLKAQITR